MDANGNNRVDRDEVLAVIALYLFDEPINEAGPVTPPGADDPIEVSGEGTDVRRIDLSEGLWTLEASVTGNEKCFGNSCLGTVFFVDIESVAGGSASPIIESGTDWEGTVTFRVGTEIRDRLAPGKQVVSVDAVGSWTLRFTKE